MPHNEYDHIHRQVLEAIPDGVTVQDLDFNIIFQNNAMKQAFGTQTDQKCYRSYERRNQICEGCGLVKAYKTGKPVMVHRTGVLENGQVEHWENSCFPLFDDNGDIVAGVEVCRNVTDRVFLAQEVRDRTLELGRLNDQLYRQKQELEKKTMDLQEAYQELQRTHIKLLQQAKMASIGQLAAGIAHEMNTPIQFMGDNISFLHEAFDDLLCCIRKSQKTVELADKNNGELIKLHSQIDSIFEETDFEYLQSEIPVAFDATKDGVQRVAEIVLAMKSFAQIDNPYPKQVDIDDLIRATVEVTRNSWQSVATLSMDLCIPSLVVIGVHGELGQVLLNLIMNAVDAIAKGHPPSDKGTIKIQTRRTNNWGEIVVTDSGCGMEQALMEKIFDPFFTTKEVGKGTGQGLSIAYSIITEAHGGDLLVESTSNKGSSFIVRLPLSNSKES